MYACFRLVAPSAVVACAVLVRPTPVSADSRAAAALKPLIERFDAATGDRAALAKDLLAFRRTHPATSEAIQAAALLAKLPSVLDQMDASKIKPIERFDWQPKELVGVLGEHLGRHASPVTCVAFSPDGKHAASGGSHFVRLWDPATMRLRHLFDIGYITCITFSRDSKYLGAGFSSGAVYVWDMTPLAGPQQKFVISASTTSIPGIAFGPEDRIAVACGDGQLRVWNVGGTDLKEVATVNAHEKPLGSVAWSPDGKVLVTGSHDTTMKLWTLGEGGLKEMMQVPGHTGAVTVLTFNPAGTTLASGCPDGSVRLWTMAPGAKPKERLVIQYPNSGAVNALSFSNTGNTLAAAYADHTGHIWSVTGTKPVEKGKLEGHAGPMTGIAWAPDNRTMLTGSSDWTVRSWDVTGAKPSQRHEPWSHLSYIYATSFSPDCLTLATGSYDTVLRLWDMARSEPRTRSFLKGESIPLYTVNFSPDGKYVAAGGQGDKVTQWEAATGRQTRRYPSPSGAVYNVAFSPDSKQIMFSTLANVMVFDTDKTKELMRITGHESRLHQAAFSPDGRHALTGSGQLLYKDGKVVYDAQMRPVYVDCCFKLWELESGKELFCDKSPTLPVTAVAFSTDGKQAFSAMQEPRVRRWNVADEKLTEGEPIKGTTGYMYSMVVAPDNQTVLTRGLDGSLVLWDLASGTRLKQWAFHENIGGVSYAPDGRHIAVGLGTGVIYVLRIDMK
jgi:WD40 repeat protein